MPLDARIINPDVCNILTNRPLPLWSAGDREMLAYLRNHSPWLLPGPFDNQFDLVVLRVPDYSFEQPGQPPKHPFEHGVSLQKVPSLYYTTL